MSLYGGRVPLKNSIEVGSNSVKLFEKVQFLLSSDPWKVITPILLGVVMAVAVLSLLLYLEDWNAERKFKAEAKNK